MALSGDTVTLAASGTDGAANSPTWGWLSVCTMLPGMADNLRPERPFLDAGIAIFSASGFSGIEGFGEVGSPLLIFGVVSMVAAPVSLNPDVSESGYGGDES